MENAPIIVCLQENDENETKLLHMQREAISSVFSLKRFDINLLPSTPLHYRLDSKR